MLLSQNNNLTIPHVLFSPVVCSRFALAFHSMTPSLISIMVADHPLDVEPSCFASSMVSCMPHKNVPKGDSDAVMLA